MLYSPVLGGAACAALGLCLPFAPRSRPTISNAPFQTCNQQFLDAGIRLTEQAIDYQIVKVHLTRIADVAFSPLGEGEAEKSKEEPDVGKPLALDRLFYRYGSNEPMVLNGVSSASGLLSDIKMAPEFPPGRSLFQVVGAADRSPAI